MPHHRARFTARGRWEVVRRVVEHGETFAQAAAWANVSKSTVHGWVGRWRSASAAERASLACLAERSSRPHRSPGRVPAEEERRICELRERTGWSPRRLADEPEIARSHSTVHRVLWRAGISRRPRPERADGRALPVAVPGPAAAHGHQEARQVQAARARRHRRPAAALAPGRLGVRALDHRRLQPARLQRDPRRRDRRHRHRLHRARARLLPRPRRRRRAADDRQRVRLHPQPLAARAARTGARSATCAPGPTRPAPTARSSATSRRSSASGRTRSSTPPATRVGPRCHTGCATTTSGAPTAPSATALPSNAFGRSPGSTARTTEHASLATLSGTAAFADHDLQFALAVRVIAALGSTRCSPGARTSICRVDPAARAVPTPRP